MDRMIYLSMAGAKATMQRQDTLANNLANVSTVGFRAELAAFRAVAMKGGAWLAVQSLDGTEAYTRGGSLDVTQDGTLVTTSGLTVLGDGGPIQVPQNVQLAIGGDGTISATAVNGKSTTIGRLKMVTPEAAFERGTDGLFRAADGAELPADATARLQDGALEGSNVSAVETMVAMIAAARQFEAQMKMLQTADGNEKAAAQLLSAS
jgi:flagellar basal-body rod protein FlgF